MISAALEKFWLKNLLGLVPYRYRTPGGHTIVCRRRYEVNMCRSFFEKKFYHLNDLPGPMEYILDAGANIGVFSALCLEQFAGCLKQITAIEPFEENFKRIKKMAGRNGWSAVLLAEHAALGDHCGSAPFYMPKVAHHSFTLRPEAGAKSAIVPLMTLDRLIELHRFPRLDLLKLDIEGSEMDALRSGSETLRRTRTIIVETHEPHTTFESIQAILGPYGFAPCSERHRTGAKNCDYYFTKG